jgi:hypothetical protein
MSQKFEVKVRATRPHQYAVGGRYNMTFGDPNFQEANSHCPYKFHCTHLWGIDRDGTWIYAGIGEFDDRVWQIIAESMKTTPSTDSPQIVEDTGIPITLIDKGDN